MLQELDKSMFIWISCIGMLVNVSTIDYIYYDILFLMHAIVSE